MMPPNAIQVLRQEQDSRWNPDTTVTQLIRVVFMVGRFGPFTETFERKDFTAQKRDARLAELAREVWIDPPPA